MDSSKVSKTDYSQVAKYYDRVRPAPSSVLSSRIIEYGRIGADCKVLEVGCGTGRFTLQLSTVERALFFGLEPSIEMLRQAFAKDKSRNVLWIRGDGQQLPFKDSIFDCVYMTMVLHHIENKEMALREIYRTVKNGGNCVVMTTSHSRIRKHVLNDFPGVTAIDLKRIPPVPFVKKVMTEIGFRNVRYHPVKYVEGEIPLDEYLERVRNKYISTLTLLSQEAFNKGFNIFQQKARKKYGDYIRRVSGFVFVVGQK